VPWASSDVSQQQFYEQACQQAVADFIDAANCDSGILAYGATGSGKTFTTQGPRNVFLAPLSGAVNNEVLPEDGVLQRCLRQIIEVRSSHRFASA
jgi:hypothetical protein